MQKPVVNLINFIRGAEPRNPLLDLTETTRHEIELHNQYSFPNTILLQYDAMENREILSMLESCDREKTEFGIWFEFCESLIRASDIEWHGRPGYSWDFHVDPAFCFAYTKEQKYRITDECMRLYFELFGAYPKSVGSWLLDSDTVLYMKEKYGVTGFAICREQWGTDGYTLWGGYYNGPYYPSRNNLFTPAQTKKEQIDAPVFRLLGADPIYCYAEHFHERFNGLPGGLFTLEPTWECGQSPKWVDWYFDVLTQGASLSYSYTQTGQENNFPWETMKESLPMQYEKIDRLWKVGKITLQTMKDAAEAFRNNFEITPPAAMTALSDWAELGHQSVWYYCKNYRIDLYRDGKNLLIRDLHKFDESVRDPYLDKPTHGATSYSDNLPLIDGLRFSSDDTAAGIYLGPGEIKDVRESDGDLQIFASCNGADMKLILNEEQIRIETEKDMTFRFVAAKTNAYDKIPVVGHDEKGIQYRYHDTDYKLHLLVGSYRDQCFLTDRGELLITVR